MWQIRAWCELIREWLASGESLFHRSCGLFPLYDMKLLAVKIAMASGPEQRLFLIGGYKVGGCLISELREVMAAAKE